MNRYLRLSLTFGSIAAAMVVLYFLVLQYLVKDVALAQMSSLDILITLACGLFAMGYFRDRKQGGQLHFWQGAVIGLETAAIATTLACLAIYLIVRIDPTILQSFLDATKADMLQRMKKPEFQQNANLTQMIQAQLAMLSNVTPFQMIFFPGGIFVKNLALEILLTGMIAAMMRKNVSHLGQTTDAHSTSKQ